MESEGRLAGKAEDAPAPEEEAHWQQIWRQENAFAPQGAGASPVLVVAGGGSGDSLTLDEVRQHVLADFHARFLRMRGSDVLFSVGVGPSAPRNGDGGASGSAGQREQLEALGLSIDWTRSFVRDQPDALRWLQQTFLALLKVGLVVRRDAPTRWCERCRAASPGEASEGEPCPNCGEPLRQLPAGAWFLELSIGPNRNPDAATASMARASHALAPTDLLGRTPGWELDVKTTNGVPLSLFTEDPDKLEEAKFVGISPRHPALEQLIEDPGLKARLQEMLSGKAGPGDAIADTGIWAHVPPLPDPLPVVVTPAVDSRFGVTSYLGTPSADPGDAAILKSLPPPPSLRWSVKAKPPKPRQAERFKLDRLPLSTGDASEPSLSVSFADCPDCGLSPAPLEAKPDGDLPVACGKCGKPARAEEVRLDRRAATWAETLVAIPPEEREVAELGHPDIQRWAAEMHTFHEASAGNALLGDLALIEALGVDGAAGSGGDGEAPAMDLVAGPIREDAEAAAGQVDLEQLVQRFGADALRFAILHGSAPTKGVDRDDLEAALAPAARFLARLRRYAEPRLAPASNGAGEAADADDPLRNRLRKWCRTARWKVTENEERLDAHRATRNVQALLVRIEDFEQQAVSSRGELTVDDREAIREALCLLIGLLAPIAPHLAEGLWKQAGMEGLASRAPWPAAV